MSETHQNANEEKLAELLAKLNERKVQMGKMDDALKRLVATHQTASEEVERLKREVATWEEDTKYLWHEIRMLRHGYDSAREILAFKEKEVLHLEESAVNDHRRLEYMEQVIARQQAIILRHEQEHVLKQQHFDALRQTRGWKIGKKFSKEEFAAQVDLSVLPEIPEEIVHPELVVLSEKGKPPVIDPFEEKYEKDPDIPGEFMAELEAPRSFSSPAVGQKIKCSGWCCDESGQPAAKMWAVVGETETPIATGVVRQDVADRFSPEKVVTSTCGFHGEVSTGPGENFIEIHAEFVDGSSAMLFKRLVVNLGFETTPKRQLDEDYLAWVECFDTVGIQDRQKMESAIKKFETHPLISVLLPVYNTEERWLCEAIESVKGQTYPNWELCIADDASPLPHVREILEKYATSDERIKVVYREENGHISATTNSALELATGEFCALLDHDDSLPPHAFYYVAKEINEHSDADLIFSDEDKIDADGKRFDPYFKSDWNPDLFLSHNCISHLGVYRTSILREIEGFNEDLNGSQDWDMALRFLLKTTPERIRHIPRVLYHWRYLDTSTSKSIDSKPYAIDAGQKAIEQYLEARGVSAEVMQGMWSGAYRVKYAMSKQTKVSIIIPFRDQASVTERCVRSILEKTELRNFEILLVDNESEEEETKEFIESVSAEEKVQVLSYPHPFNFAAINNHAATKATGDVVLFLNNDVEVAESSWLKELASQAMRDEIGAVG
ncbi:MAG: glycosyltransferase, partial [Opitutales bacterium]|nr:glycosyltransferase [Opitutales bacterium]